MRRRRSKSQRVKIDELHMEACQRGEDTYIDPSTGLSVFTRLAHERRGKCCGCGCRHCPYRESKQTQNIEDIGQNIEGVTPKVTSVYTKTGDGGKSSLFNGERKHKSNATFDALGDVDELTANIGIAYEKCRKISKLWYDFYLSLFFSSLSLRTHHPQRDLYATRVVYDNAAECGISCCDTSKSIEFFETRANGY